MLEARFETKREQHGRGEFWNRADITKPGVYVKIQKPETGYRNTHTHTTWVHGSLAGRAKKKCKYVKKQVKYKECIFVKVSRTQVDWRFSISWQQQWVYINIVFASRSGDIAIRTQGKLPLRKKDQGKFIQEGTSSDQFCGHWSWFCTNWYRSPSCKNKKTFKL